MSPTDYAHQAAALAELTAATKMWRQAEALRVREASALTAAIRAAFDAGVARTDIAEVTGLSRTRIYEIRDGK